LLILFIINTIGLYKTDKNVEFQKSFTHGDNYFMVRETKDEPNFSLVYEKRHKILIYLVDKIIVKDGYKPFLKNTYEVVWASEEKALIKYSFGKEHKAKGDILNFTKINGAYANLLGSLEGNWADKSLKNTLDFKGGQITYKISKATYWYSSSQAGEQGNYGSILYGTKDTPTLYIIKNADNSLTVGYVDLKNKNVSIYSRVNSARL